MHPCKWSRKLNKTSVGKNKSVRKNLKKASHSLQFETKVILMCMSAERSYPQAGGLQNWGGFILSWVPFKNFTKQFSSQTNSSLLCEPLGENFHALKTGPCITDRVRGLLLVYVESPKGRRHFLTKRKETKVLACLLMSNASVCKVRWLQVRLRLSSQAPQFLEQLLYWK